MQKLVSFDVIASHRSRNFFLIAGYGVLKFQSGEIYEGHWEKNNYHGLARHTTAEGTSPTTVG